MDVVSGFKLPYVIGENVPKAFTSIDDFKFHSSLKEVSIKIIFFVALLLRYTVVSKQVLNV